MSNKEFESKVLKALDNIQGDISELKTDVFELKTDVSELKTDVSGLKQDVSTLKIQMVKLDSKIDSQTFELKQEIRLNTNYLDQAFQ
ncbi:MAG: hypothetical protein Q9M94_04410 [Candidatus Gracilibacteria bacterium]|nr:hypothetical protein [Candidatus Gracilibacteria bacterium]MDQ7023695.1 hypothetical protein [Candidatus Gracilibacteria bacterium]